ncbi:hypothetical protein NFI95_10410 [Acetobacteraceae bacterium KSS8]|uniref:non-specific serine/threonine protein kinase n=1 Tax=Endosaccharibacter trunci TaxID=2812733 RepID=A0ABT1W7K2_9PROT|nr:hypothetical protein [Acetobacteraceae bacterium KSS8]
MTGNGEAESGSIVIGGRFRVLPDQPREGYAGLFSCAVDHAATAIDQVGAPPLVAVRARRDAPPPANLQSYIRAFNSGLLMPVAHGMGGGAYWIVCDAPPGPSLLQAPPPQPLNEAELINSVLKPLAQALGRLHTAGLTHRAVRPANLFRSESGRILLGPGCLVPPAFDQPVLYEPPQSGVCAPHCRGPGLAADDVYALGVVLLELLLGRPLLADMTDNQIVQRKIEVGSYQTLAAAERLPPAFVSLLRAMLSDDPLGRPSISALAEQGVGAERPKAPRPESRAPRPLMLGRTPIFTARMLAQAFSRQPIEALAFLRAGTVDQWLRRALEQPMIAVRMEEALRTGRDRTYEGSDAMLLMQVIAMLDPLAPMFWHGIWIWPDAVPTMLARVLAEGADVAPFAEMLQTRALRRWSFVSGRVVSVSVEEVERRNNRTADLAPGLRLASLSYALNPLLPCLSPVLSRNWVLGAEQLLAALEAQEAVEAGSGRLLDMHMLAMLAARVGADEEPGAVPPSAEKDLPMLDLFLLARAQKYKAQKTGQVGAFPRLAGRLLPAARERLKSWPGKGRRTRRLERLERMAEAGDLPAMLLLVDQDDARALDEQALGEARRQVESLRAAHQASLDAGEVRAAAARIGGQDLGIAAGVLGLLVAVVTEFVL